MTPGMFGGGIAAYAGRRPQALGGPVRLVGPREGKGEDGGSRARFRAWTRPLSRLNRHMGARAAPWSPQAAAGSAGRVAGLWFPSPSAGRGPASRFLSVRPVPAAAQHRLGIDLKSRSLGCTPSQPRDLSIYFFLV